MGLACSQVRMLTLMNRKADNELQTMLISNKKLALSREQSALSQEYYSKLQTKKLNYYKEGAYVPITYSYLMGDSSQKDSMINKSALSLCSPEILAQNGVDTRLPDIKDENSIILTDYRGLVVLNNEYAKAIQNVCGNGVSWDGNGKGSTFSQTKIGEIIANYLGFEEDDLQYKYLIAVYNKDEAKLNELKMGIENIKGTKPNGEQMDREFISSQRKDTYQAIIDFYRPIFLAAATNGWTTEYTANIGDSDYMSNALTSGIFQLATVNPAGDYEAGTSLQYYLNAAFVTERRDSQEQAEITAWYNLEKEKIAAKEDYWDVELTNLSTELNAIQAEIESVQSLIDDAVSSVFDWGS